MPEAVENNPEEAVASGKPRGRARFTEDYKFLAKSQVLQRQLRTAPQGREHRLDQRLHEDPHLAILADRR